MYAAPRLAVGVRASRVMRIISPLKLKKMDCQGECKKHDECAGQIKEVIVFGEFCPTGLKFNYCQTAREEDERRGFTVEIIDEHGLTPSDYYDGVTYPNG